ncbi:hypothetical protein ACFQL0_17200 [Haloplanus litoreus]|uniref:hypothetical protein n=1 Tax=Haloplanus litoreus TaxID=767515 RepID=UPI00361D5965
MDGGTDFLLALIKTDGWLGESAEAVSREHRNGLWTSQFSLIELLPVANAVELLEVRGDAETMLAAASYVAQEGLTPFDALHSSNPSIVSNDKSRRTRRAGQTRRASDR